MVLPKKFQSQDRSIVSFDFVDIAEGTGTIVYHGLVSEISGASSFKLSQTDDFSSLIETTETTFPATTTMDFDSPPFNLQRVLKGIASASIPFYMAQGNANYAHVTAEMFVVNSGVATSISDEVFSTNTVAGGEGKQMFLPMPLTQTILKVGEQVRCTVKLVTRDGAVNANVGHDPQGRDGTNITTANKMSSIMKVNIPFRVDL